MRTHLNETTETLDFYDLLIDESTDELSEYLSISVKSDGKNTKVSISTVDSEPTVYSTILDGIVAPDLKSILGDAFSHHRGAFHF